MKKPTLHDVAIAAGVSYATADRVLNARGGVSAKSEARVREAIKRLDYRRDVHAANLSRRRIYRFRLLLPSGDHSFFSALHAAATLETVRRARDRVSVTIENVPAFDPVALSHALSGISASNCDCVGFLGLDDAQVQAQTQRLARGGVAVLTLVSDAPLPQRAAYVGIDNVGAGRTAGRILKLGHTGRKGLVLPLIGTNKARDHADRLQGVAEVLSKSVGIDLLPAVEAFDSPEQMQSAVESALAEHPRLSGIYSMGAGNRGMIAALAHLSPEARPLVVLHELVPHSRAALEAGLIDAVIDQKPEQEIATALDIMRALADGLAVPVGLPGITPTIYLKDNLPALLVPAHEGDKL